MFALSLDFFTNEDWTYIRESVATTLRAKWRNRPDPEDIEDAVSDAMLDLIDAWVEHPTSIDRNDPDRNRKWAIWRATKMAQSFLLQRFDLRRSEVSIDEAGEWEDEEYVPRVERLEDPSPGPEDEALDGEEARLVDELMATLPEQELKTWLADYLNGTGVREQARQEGVQPMSVSERRTRGMKRLRRQAVVVGLL